MNLAEAFFVKTTAYRTVKRDMKSGALNHAYLLVCHDAALLRDYAKAVAKLILCEKGGLCCECRVCRLIDSESFGDLDVYPPAGEKITADGITRIVSEKCYIKPLETDKRVFAIVGADSANDAAQNKLLKTLEEPPENVHIILAAASEYGVLPTVRSRSVRLTVPDFSSEEQMSVMADFFPDATRLAAAVALSDGKPGKAAAIYAENAAQKYTAECYDILTNMKKSPDIAQYSAILQKKTREEFAEFLVAMKTVCRDVLMYQEGKGELAFTSDRAEFASVAARYNEGALLAFSAALDRAIAAFDGYANQTMLADRLLFALLEENYLWQKL